MALGTSLYPHAAVWNKNFFLAEKKIHKSSNLKPQPSNLIFSFTHVSQVYKHNVIISHTTCFTTFFERQWRFFLT